ncbi:MAG: glycosyltransferase family 2 protein [Thermoanaerobaculaceae bacterium]|nr:glycosyltransferase family 2 protein [Thermoanaerobaculaceae bacterium]
MELGVSVVIPARNEGKSIAAVVAGVRAALAGAAAGGSFEVIVVSDGSHDDTATAARAAGAEVLENPESKGYGAALKRGFRHARYPFVAIIDGDGTYPPEAIPGMIEDLVRGADQVIGSRTTGQAHVPLLRRPAKWLVRVLASAFTRQPIPDLNSGLRALRRSTLESVVRLLPDGFSCTTTLTVAGLLSGWHVTWHPIDYHRRTGTSKFRPVRDTGRLVLSLLRAVVYFDPLRLFLPLALVLGVVGAGLAAYDVFVEHNLTDKTVLTSLTALQFLVLGLLADLIAKRNVG